MGVLLEDVGSVVGADVEAPEAVVTVFEVARRMEGIGNCGIVLMSLADILSSEFARLRGSK